MEIKQGLDQGDSQALSFNFQIPTGLSDKYYNLELTSEYDYSNGVYRDFSDISTSVPLRVFGCTASSDSESFASITANLQSDVKAGEDLSVSATIRNTGSQSAQFTIDVKGYSDWAKLNSISDRLVTIAAGESKTVQISILPNSDVAGSQTFSIEARSGSQVQTKQIVVDFPGSSNALVNSLKTNTTAWIIGLVNVILIILIIIVAVKLSRN